MQKFLLFSLIVFSSFSDAVAKDCKFIEKNFDKMIAERQVFDIHLLETCNSLKKLPNFKHNLGLLHLLGINTPININRGLSLLFESANSGNIDSVVAMGEFYILDENTEIFLQGVELLNIGFERGNASAKRTLYKLMSHKKIPYSYDIEYQFNQLIKNHDGEATLIEARLAVNKSITEDKECYIVDMLENIHVNKLDTKTKADLYYLIAQAYITKTTSFYDINYVVKYLKKAAENQHLEASELLDGLKSID